MGSSKQTNKKKIRHPSHSVQILVQRTEENTIKSVLCVSTLYLDADRT